MTHPTAGVHGAVYWTSLQRLVAACRLVVDRPLGSCHPRFPAFVYPLDHGWLEGSSGSDGSEVDAWAGGGDRAVVTGVAATVDLHKRDAELRLLLGCTRAEMELILATHNQPPQAAILVSALAGQPEGDAVIWERATTEPEPREA